MSDEVIVQNTGMPNSDGSVVLTELFSGPIPHAKLMAEYQAVDPALPLRIMDMAIKEQENRHFIDRKKVEVVEKKFANQAEAQRQDFDFGKRGQWMAFVLAILFLAVVTYLGYLKLETAISWAFGAGGFVAIFSFLAPRLLGKRHQQVINLPAPSQKTE